MAKILVISGPEKAGKTTLIKQIQKEAIKLDIEMDIRKQSGKAEPNDAIYLVHIIEDLLRSDVSLVVWDRSWVAEYVYGHFFSGRRLTFAPLIGEWFYSRFATGKWILLGPNDATLSKNRDSSDLNVPVHEERSLYRNYARTFNWNWIENIHESVYCESLAQTMIEDTMNVMLPFGFIGNPEPDVIVLDHIKNNIGVIPFCRPNDELIMKMLLPLTSPLLGMVKHGTNLDILNDYHVPILCLDHEVLSLVKKSLDIPERAVEIQFPPYVSVSSEYAKTLETFYELAKDSKPISNLLWPMQIIEKGDNNNV